MPRRFSFAVCFLILIFSAFFSVSAQRIRTVKATPVDNNETASFIASPLVTDDFSYTAGTLLTANGWTSHSGGGTNDLTVVAPSLTYSGYPGSSVGNAVAMAANGQDVNRSFASPVTSGSLYAAVLVNVTSSTTTGDYFFHFYFNASTFYGKVFIQKDTGSNKFAFGVSRNANIGAGALFTGYDYVPGTTYLLVVKYTFVGGGANNDTVNLFVNPPLGGSEPAPTLTASDFTAADLAEIPGIGIRQGGAGSGSTQIIDGIRVGTTWADVGAGGGPIFQRANVDMNGDGRTDFLLIQDPGLAFTGGVESSVSRPRLTRHPQDLQKALGSDAQAATFPLEWAGVNNQAAGGTNVTFGDSDFGDVVISADFDGDTKDDVAIWRPGQAGQASFYSINSSDFTIRISNFGQSGDNPTVAGDYDGDGTDDDAVYRCPINTQGTCYYLIKLSLNNPNSMTTQVPWGFGQRGDFYPLVGDFDGDGKLDFCIQGESEIDPQQANFQLFLSATLTNENISWGYSNDFLIPGDYDGDGRSDFCVMRWEGGQSVYYILERDGGIRVVSWGFDSDVPAPGDYDGDGRQDIVAHRWNVSDDTTTYWILPSSGAAPWTFTYAAPGFEPVAKWYVQ